MKPIHPSQRILAISAFAALLVPSSSLQAVIVANLYTDLDASWSDTGQGAAVGIPDQAGGSYTVGWIQDGTVLPTVGNNQIMGGWGWPDDPGSRSPGFPRGYSWDGTHDTGWAGQVGFETDAGAGVMRMRGNANWNDYTSGSSPTVQWTSGVAGTATITFAVSHSHYAGALFGIYDYQTGLWASANGGDNLFTSTPNAVARTVDGSGLSNVEMPGYMTYTTTVAIGDKFHIESPF